MTKLSGQAAFISGASQGIGRAIAIELAKAGADVGINYFTHAHEADQVAQICRAAGVQAEAYQANVADRDELNRAVAMAIENFGRLDIAVSNAAFSRREIFYQADMDDFHKTVDVTFWGAFYLVRAAARHMVAAEQGGSIVVISSPHAYTPVAGAMAYNLAKAAVDQMARTAATELLPRRIRVNLVHPGWIDTPGERQFLSEEELMAQGRALPWGRLGRPEEIARGVLFLCDPDSDYVTGSSLRIDGGISLPWGSRHGFQTE